MPAGCKIGDLLDRIQGEYLELPGLSLTEAQAQRLWDLDRTTCGAMFEALVDVRFLRRSPDGSFVKSRSHDLESVGT
jgi:hypothetical protein